MTDSKTTDTKKRCKDVEDVTDNDDNHKKSKHNDANKVGAEINNDDNVNVNIELGKKLLTALWKPDCISQGSTLISSDLLDLLKEIEANHCHFSKGQRITQTKCQLFVNALKENFHLYPILYKKLIDQSIFDLGSYETVLKELLKVISNMTDLWKIVKLKVKAKSEAKVKVKTKTEKKSTKAKHDPKLNPYLGQIFVDNLASYSSPNFYRVIGFTPKRVIVEDFWEMRETGSNHCKIDRDYLENNPITKPKTKSGDGDYLATVSWDNDDNNDNGKVTANTQHPCLKVNGEYAHYVDDLNTVYIWSDY